EVNVAEHRGLLLLISTHATYITYLPVERRVPFEVPSTFSAASLAAPLQSVNALMMIRLDYGDTRIV
ncbi:MAG: hypothetical protein WBM04_16185, partial [Candidatus Korobacteraceae bacterium]